MTDLFGLMISLLFVAVGWVYGYDAGLRKQ